MHSGRTKMWIKYQEFWHNLSISATVKSVLMGGAWWCHTFLQLVKTGEKRPAYRQVQPTRGPHSRHLAQSSPKLPKLLDISSDKSSLRYETPPDLLLFPSVHKTCPTQHKSNSCNTMQLTQLNVTCQSVPAIRIPRNPYLFYISNMWCCSHWSAAAV